jgi:hypothetical protein
MKKRIQQRRRYARHNNELEDVRKNLRMVEKSITKVEKLKVVPWY